MASLQSYPSHGLRYYRIVESFRKNGKPHIRVLEHLGRADDILARLQGRNVSLSSVSAGAVTALYNLANELDIVHSIDAAVAPEGKRVQTRDGLSVGQTLLAGIIGRVCAPRSKRAFSGWAASTSLPRLMDVHADKLSSEHFWEQMNAVPVKKLADIEQHIVATVLDIEHLQVQALAYDTTNFFTHIATTNARPELPQRGHNKQGRHDLRQLGLALIVDQASQLPLAHELYAGARSDMRSFSEFLKPVRARLRALTRQPEQLTLVFDAGAASAQNIAVLAEDRDHYVTTVRPSNVKSLLAEAADHLSDLTLSNGSVVRAWRTRRQIAGREHETVVVFSRQLLDGQVRGLHQHLRRCSEQMAKIGLEPSASVESVTRRLKATCARQYLRELVRYEVQSGPRPGASTVCVWCDLDRYRQLLDHYFGLRVLITDRADWSTAQIIEAYRGQAKAEASFRDLKDPGMLATRPQFHWTDQKLRVHAFMCVTGCLLSRLLCWRARRIAGFNASPRSLLNELGRVRLCRVVEHTGRAGRPRVREQIEEIDPALRSLAQSLKALPQAK